MAISLELVRIEDVFPKGEHWVDVSIQVRKTSIWVKDLEIIYDVGLGRVSLHNHPGDYVDPVEKAWLLAVYQAYLWGREAQKACSTI